MYSLWEAAGAGLQPIRRVRPLLVVEETVRHFSIAMLTCMDLADLAARFSWTTYHRGVTVRAADL